MTILKRCFIVVIIIFLASSLSYAQGANQHKVKDRIDVGGGQFVEILQIKGTGANEEWYVQYYRGTDKESTPRWESSESLKIAEQRILDAKKQQNPEVNIPAPKKVEKTPGKEAEAKPLAVNNANCNFIPPYRAIAAADNFSVALAQRKIYDTYARNVNGTGQAPLRVGITFISFTTGTPYTNTVLTDATGGAYKKFDAAPVNAKLYPVYSKHIYCEQYRDATNRFSVEGTFVCFKDKDGNWSCPILGFPKTSSINN